MLPEPIDATHNQIEARLSYAGDRLRLSAGYYGSFYRNGNGSLNPVIPGTLNNPLGAPLPLYSGLRSLLAQPVALAPDNEAHQFDVTGNFAFAPSTRATFKFAYTKATQDQSFADAGLGGAPAGSASLGGNVETSLAQVGITSRPISRLTLSAEARYEDKKDKTPLARYFNDGITLSTNRNYDSTKTRGKLQATYHFTNDLLGTVGADYEKIDRGAYTPSMKYAGISALRQETEETGLRLELRRRMTETFSGAISLQSSDRNGSDWLKPNPGTGVAPVADPAVAFDGTSVFMPTLADRRRDKGKLYVTWQPTDSLTLQFNAEAGKDKFSAPSDQGLRNTKMELFSIDAGYTISDAWSLTGYASQGKQKLNQAKPGGYILSFDNTSTTFGLGVSGKPSEKLSLGGELSYINDKNVYSQGLDALAHPSSVILLAASGGLPDILFRRTELKLFGKYSLSERSALRLDAVYQQAKFNDWAYEYAGVPYTFSDNTTAKLKQSQDAGFLGISYIYSWR
jgi:MtrB/PioB family decaheme-associated outer membrane protein